MLASQCCAEQGVQDEVGERGGHSSITQPLKYLKLKEKDLEKMVSPSWAAYKCPDFEMLVHGPVLPLTQSAVSCDIEWARCNHSLFSLSFALQDLGR